MKTITILSVTCFFWLGTHATSWRLNNNPAIQADFTTFEEAHDAASPGDTIYVEGNGTENHYGIVTITKKLIVIGPGYFLNENDSTQANKAAARFRAITINPGAEGTEIYGLNIFYSGSGFMGITINASNVIVARNYFQAGPDRITFGPYNISNVAVFQNFAYSIITTNGYGVSNLLIANNFVFTTIELNQHTSATVINNVVKTSVLAQYSVIKNNIIYQGTTYPFGFNFGTSNEISYNLVAGTLHGGSNPPDPPGTDNVADIVPALIFVDFDGSLGYSTDGQWQLNAAGIAIGAGENGVDCGMFGGPSPYILSGMAPVPHIYEAIVPISGSTITGLPVTIKIKSQN